MVQCAFAIALMQAVQRMCLAPRVLKEISLRQQHAHSMLYT